MKKIILLIAVLFLTASSVFAQQDYKCATMEELEKQKKENPHLEAQMQAFEEQVKLWIKDHYKKGGKNQLQVGLGDEIVIPIVVHILYNNSEQYKTSTIVEEQILNFCNRDFAGININSMQAFEGLGLKVDTKVRFVMAKTAPDGSLTNGVHYVPTIINEFPQSNYMKYSFYEGCDAWDTKYYFNVWVCNTPGSVCWAQFPGSGINGTYGIVVDYAVFGSDAIVASRKNGSITSHEIGHCLNLRHIWGDDQGACTGDDYCADIPNQADYQYGCPTGIVYDACTQSGNGIMYMNFMDYTNDFCVANFTPDQTARMWACFAPGAPLEVLLSSTVGSAPIAGECHIPKNLFVTNVKKNSATLNWPVMVNAVSYNIRYKKTNSTTWTNTTSQVNYKDLTVLTRNTNYEFQVQSVCIGGGTSNYSFSYTFSTYGTDPPISLSKPMLVSPSDGQLNVPTNATFSWQQVTGANGYVILYSELSDFSSSYLISTSGLSITLSGLKDNTKYYWKVKAIFNYISGPWSDARSLTTSSVLALPPVLRYPIEGQMGVSINPTFYWYTAVGASYYELEYSKNTSFSPSVIKTGLYGNSYMVTGLTPKTNYYWRMNAVYGDIPSPWSNTWKFKTANSGKFSISEESGIVVTAASLSFAPNPFSEIAHFKLEVFEDANVTIEISDILGKKVATLTSDNYKTGAYEFDFNAGNLLTGVYYCHLIVGDEVQTMQMVIMK